MSDYEPGDTMVEAFRRANPVPADQAGSRRSLPSAHALFADVIAQRPRRVRRRVLLIVIAIALVALMLMAVAALQRAGTSAAGAPVCYGSDSLQGPRVVVAGGDPIQACAPLWESGRFGGTKVPDFDVCVLPSGVLAVFPGESGSVCSRLDLPASSGDNRAERCRRGQPEGVGGCYGPRRGGSDHQERARSAGFWLEGAGRVESVRRQTSLRIDRGRPPWRKPVIVIAISELVPPTPAEP